MVNSTPVREHITVLKQENPLYQYIQEHAKEKNVSPVNARMDPVWKAIPGYNGLQVDIETTYRRAEWYGEKKPSKWIYKQKAPEITLQDLPPGPIHRGNPHKPTICFMVNVAWGNEHLQTMLEVFAEHEIQTTFFLDGSWLKKYPEEAKKIRDAGHEIGNHAYSHPDMSQIGRARIRGEIVRTNNEIERTLGVKPRWFAPPSGDYNDQVIQIAKDMQMETVLWTVDTVDWKKPEPQRMVNRVVPKLKNGALVLMHPTASSAKALPHLIRAAKEKKLTIGTVRDVLSPERVASVE